jgi:hypothetical protein
MRIIHRGRWSEERRSFAAINNGPNSLLPSHTRLAQQDLLCAAVPRLGPARVRLRLIEGTIPVPAAAT